MRDDPPVLIELEEAWRILAEAVRPLPVVRVPLREALRAVLAEDVICDVDYPPFDRALMDGFAVRAADMQAAPRALRVIGQVAAGQKPERVLAPGEAVQINTGAPIPQGADAVVRVEDTAVSAEGARVEVRVVAQAGQFITPRAAYGRAGATVLSAGSVLSAINMGTAATAGAAEVAVYRRPRAALLSTGDELVDIDRRPAGAEIRNSNQYMLEALLRMERVETAWLGTARDARDELRRKIGEGFSYDVLCLTGGVSMGAFDFVPQVLRAAGAQVLIEKIKIKPGRPVFVALMPSGTLVFALPGNPLSAWVGFEMLVRPTLARLSGACFARPAAFMAALQGQLPATRDRRSFFPARATVDARGLWRVAAQSWQGSGDSLGAAEANALITRPANSRAVRSGELVSVFLTERA